MSKHTENTTPLPVDPKSERHRICPECQVPFMADHLLTKFCCSKHRNDFNNRRKRVIKAQTMNQVTANATEIPKESPVPISEKVVGNVKSHTDQEVVKEKENLPDPLSGHDAFSTLFGFEL